MLAMPSRRRLKAAARSESCPTSTGSINQAHALLLSELKLVHGLQDSPREHGLGDLYHATHSPLRGRWCLPRLYGTDADEPMTDGLSLPTAEATDRARESVEVLPVSGLPRCGAARVCGSGRPARVLAKGAGAQGGGRR
jgi:hypothetical protein